MAIKPEFIGVTSWMPHLQYDEYGREIPDQTAIEMPTDGFEAVSSMDLKMQFILQEMLAKMQSNQEPEETLEDDLDFDIETGEIKTKYNDYATKEDLLNVKKKLKSNKKPAKYAGDTGDAGPSETPKPVELDDNETNNENNLADE